ncbi:MAG TPA: ShlB/FhaC/HecB family hemolysin secretion/activation protein [Gammaproteobacteria bacterium]
MNPFATARLRSGVFCAALLAILPFSAANAGEQPSVTPGAVQDTIRQQPPQAPLPLDPSPPLQSGMSREATAPIGPAVRVESFILNGNDIVPDELLQAELARWTGRELTLDGIYAAADALTAFYRAQGYGLAQVTVPAQKISDGIVELQIIEGRIGAIAVTGNEDYSFEFLKRRLELLTPGRVYTDLGMERGVLLLDDLPGLSARAVITPGEEFGTSDVLFRITEDSESFSASVDNYGREELGEIRVLADAQFNNLGGFGDELYIAVLVSEDALLKYGNVSYAVPTGSNGARLRVTANRADYEVSGDLFEELGITGDNTTYRVDWSYPLLRSRSANMVFTAAGQRFETESFQDNTLIPANATELDLLELGLFMNGFLFDNHSWSLSSILAGNGKSNDSTVSNPQTDAQQAKLRVDGSYGLPFGTGWLFTSRATYVYSGDPLTDSQKFSLGGPYSVRGYAPAELRGDEGAFLSLELRKYFFPGGYPLAGAVFIDGGTATNERLPGDTVSTSADLEGELASAGLGLLFSPDGGTYSGAILLASPIDNHTSPNGDDDGHVWATFTYRF